MLLRERQEYKKIPSSRTMSLGSTQPLTRNEYQESSCGVTGDRPERKADKLTAICEPIV
jgi:hypothetical protein